MEKIKKSLIQIWDNEIRDALGRGEVILEQQLRAEIYHQLRLKFSKFKIWITPTLYLKKYDLDRIKPDLVVSNEKEILAIIQLNFKPWDFLNYKEDLRILTGMDKVGKSKRIKLGMIPFSSIWQEQKNKDENNLNFTMADDLLKVLVTGSRAGCHSLELKKDEKPSQNFLHLFGYIENETSLFFGNSFYDKSISRE
ncbi:MAG: hypothetical protein P8L89_05630 [Polaribacter sp.]|nr:hypothetical protein [Saprospiraceae bacterium]MDG2436563.1 hypothetical protein [Polaribacter sp.]